MTQEPTQAPLGVPPAAAPPPRKGRRGLDRWVKLAFLLIVLGWVGWQGVGWYFGPSLPVDFTADLPGAMRQAQAQGRNVLVVVYSRPPSEDYKTLALQRMSKPRSREAMRRSNVIVVRTTSGDASARQFNVTTTPTLLLLGPDGREIRRHVGGIGETDFPLFLEGEPP